MIMLGRPCHSRLGQQCFLLRLFIGVPIGTGDGTGDEYDQRSNRSST